MGVSARRGSSSQIASNMRAFILSLVVVAVTGDAKPWTVAQVAAGEPVKNAIAEGRLHNIGVITNAAEAGVTHVGAAPLDYQHLAAFAAPYYSSPYYGKREAEADPYTLAQVAAGQTAGGVITSVGGHPVVPFRSVPGHAPLVYHHAAPLVYY